MTEGNLGRLKKVELREAWKHEAMHFTRWLAEEKNLSLLGDELGLEIKHVETEAAVGSFSVDILAEEEGTGRNIIIENQLEQTNHDHLGKLVTYASGYGAKIIIWIVKEAREEHRQAVDWLNEHTDEDVEFYLVRIELWQIGNSPYAPKFEIVSKPNDWTRTVRRSGESGKLTDTKVRQLDFWNRFKEYAGERGTKLHLRKMRPGSWTSISIGSAEAHISLTIHSRENKFGTEIYISDNKELYRKLFEHREDIDHELGEAAEWMELPNKKASRVRLLHQGDFDDTDSWEDTFEWLINEAEKFHKVFPKYIRTEE